MTVFDRLVGQDEAVRVLRAAAADAAERVAGRPGDGALAHAWVVHGPPGSGRSTAGRVLAAAVQCSDGGCGRCHDCRTALSGTHTDVELVRTEGLSLGVGLARRIVETCARRPSLGRFRVTVVEQADRLTEQAQNALLKILEEPPERSVLVLCTPTGTDPDELKPTIRSRCRSLALRTPSVEAVAQALVADGVHYEKAVFFARAAQGHVGRARWLATDLDAERSRRDVLAIPTALSGVPGCFPLARQLVDSAAAQATAQTQSRDAAELEELKIALGGGLARGTGRATSATPKGGAGAVKELERTQKLRRTRVQRDLLDRVLVDLTGFYRDVLSQQLGTGVPLVHGDVEPQSAAMAARAPSTTTLRRIDAVLACREAIGLNVAPLLAIEAMLVTLVSGAEPAPV